MCHFLVSQSGTTTFFLTMSRNMNHCFSLQVGLLCYNPKGLVTANTPFPVPGVQSPLSSLCCIRIPVGLPLSQLCEHSAGKKDWPRHGSERCTCAWHVGSGFSDFLCLKGSQIVSMNSRGVHVCSVVSCTKHRQLSGGLKLGCSWCDVKGLRKESMKLLLQQQLCFSGYQVCHSV